MQARIVAAGRGARWLAEGWRLFRVAPLAWLAAVFGYWLLMSLVSLLPLIGVAAAAVLVPAFSVGFMALARAAGRRAPLELGLLFDGFRHELRAQMTLAPGGGYRLPVASFVLPLLIVLLPTLFASFYVSYRDVFGYDAAP